MRYEVRTRGYEALSQRSASLSTTRRSSEVFFLTRRSVDSRCGRTSSDWLRIIYVAIWIALFRVQAGACWSNGGVLFRHGT